MFPLFFKSYFLLVLASFLPFLPSLPSFLPSFLPDLNCELHSSSVGTAGPQPRAPDLSARIDMSEWICQNRCQIECQNGYVRIDAR